MNEDILAELGPLVLGSRFKRLSDRLMQDGHRIYRESGIPFEPKWFPVYYYLSSVGPSPVTEIARGLGITHPSVNQVAKEMIADGLVVSYKDTRDKRKRVLALTRDGKAMKETLRPVWQAITDALNHLVADLGVDFMGYIGAMDRALDRQSFYERFSARHVAEIQDVEILTFSDDYAEDFRRLNEAWILNYFEMEEADDRVLGNPRGYIVEPGGEVLFARQISSGDILATCAIIAREHGQAELAKMTVTAAARGRGIGKLIGVSALQTARQLGFTSIYLETNAILAPALGLYRDLGFAQKPSPFDSDYVRADVYMEMSLV